MWRLPTLTPAVSRVVSTAVEAVVLVAVTASVVSYFWDAWGWAGLVAAPLMMVSLRLFWPVPVPDDEGCLKCKHASLHHHGNCQACLRLIQQGEAPTTPVPCARFRRWSPRTRWSGLRDRDGLRAKLDLLVRS